MAGAWLADLAKSDGVGFQRKVDFGIDVGGADGDVAEPGADGVDVDTCQNKVAGRRVTDHMWAYRPLSQCRHLGCATLDEAVYSEASKRRSEPADKYGVPGRAPKDLIA